MCFSNKSKHYILNILKDKTWIGLDWLFSFQRWWICTYKEAHFWPKDILAIHMEDMTQRMVYVSQFLFDE